MNVTNILVVDDSKLITKLISKALLSNKIKEYHFDKEHIFIAYDGMQAFELLGKHPEISFIISDVNMPELNGDELIEILIDTKKISDLDVIFVTTQNTDDQLSSITKNHTLGTIYKPFTDASFCDHFEKIIEQKHVRALELESIQKELLAQKRLILSWAHIYIQEKEFKVAEQAILSVIDEECDMNSIIGDDEFYPLFIAIMDTYCTRSHTEHTLDMFLLKDIYDRWLLSTSKEDSGSLKLLENVQTIIKTTNSSLTHEVSTEELVLTFVQPLIKLLNSVSKKCKSLRSLPEEDFLPFFPTIIEIFTKIDPHFKNRRLHLLLEHIDELHTLQSWLHGSIEDNTLEASLPFLAADRPLIDLLATKFSDLIGSIDQIISCYIHETESTLWSQAKRSPKIVSFLKTTLKQNVPNTHNLLYALKKIPKTQLREYEKYQKSSCVVLSDELELLTLFKDDLSLVLPLWDIALFRRFKLFQHKLTKTEPHILIIDLSYNDGIFKNGLQLATVLYKQIPNVRQCIDKHGLFFIASLRQVEQLHNSKTTLPYNLLIKPLTLSTLHEQLFYP